MSKLPFTYSRETEHLAVDRSTRDPAKRELLHAMVDAVLHVKEIGAVSPADLAPILKGFEATDERVWSTAAGWLAKLHGFDPRLTATLEELSRHPDRIVRRNLCASLDRFPAEAAEPSLRNLLKDKSAPVRSTALGTTMHKNLHSLLPDLKQCLATAKDKDKEWREELEFAISIMEKYSATSDGLTIRKLPNGDFEAD